MYCTKCGNQVPDDAQFCEKCGTPVKTEQVKEQPVQRGKETENKSYYGAIIVVGILILALVAAGIWMIVDSKNADRTVNIEETAMTDEAAEEAPEPESETDAMSADETETEEGAEIPDAEEDAGNAEAAAEPEETEEVVFEPWDIDIDAEMDYIRSWCADTDKTLDYYDYYDFGDFSCYAQDGTPVKIMVKSGYDGWDYNREYYGTGKFYMHVYNVSEDYEFCFSDSKLMRYYDEKGNIHDYGEEDWADCVKLSERAAEEHSELFSYISDEID